MEIARARLKYADNFEYDQFEHGYGKRKSGRKDQLNRYVSDLIVFKQLFVEEQPTAGEE